jgi:hypothetical protein
LLAPTRRCVLHDLISNTLDYVYSEIFYKHPGLQLEAHRTVIKEAGLVYPADSERRILDGNATLGDKSKTYDVIAAATEKIEIPAIFHMLFADRNFIFSFQHDLQCFLKT